MFTITGQVVAIAPKKKKNSEEVYANNIQIMAGSDNHKSIFNVTDFDMTRQYPEGEQVTLAVNVKSFSFKNGGSGLDLVAFKDQSVMSNIFKQSKTATS
jgi:hypothetical protein